MDSSTPPEPNDGFASEEEFEAWLRAHPENKDYFMDLIARAEKGEFGEVPTEFSELSRMVLEKYAASERLRVVQRVLKDFFDELQRVHDGSPTSDALRALHGRCGEVIDAALDLPEPHRAEVLRQLLPLRDNLQSIAEKLS